MPNPRPKKQGRQPGKGESVSTTTVAKRQPTKHERIVNAMIAKEVAAHDRRVLEIVREMTADIRSRKQAAVKRSRSPK